MLCFWFLCFQDDIDNRPRVSTFISSLANYSNTIPAATDPDVKPPAPVARMGNVHKDWLSLQFLFLVFDQLAERRSMRLGFFYILHRFLLSFVTWTHTLCGSRGRLGWIETTTTAAAVSSDNDDQMRGNLYIFYFYNENCQSLFSFDVAVVAAAAAAAATAAVTAYECAVHFILLLQFFILSTCRHIDRCILAMYPKYIRCHSIYSIDMGRWHGWSHLRISDCPCLLLCGKYGSHMWYYLIRHIIPLLLQFLYFFFYYKFCFCTFFLLLPLLPPTFRYVHACWFSIFHETISAYLSFWFLLLIYQFQS